MSKNSESSWNNTVFGLITYLDRDLNTQNQNNLKIQSLHSAFDRTRPIILKTSLVIKQFCSNWAQTYLVLRISMDFCLAILCPKVEWSCNRMTIWKLNRKSNDRLISGPVFKCSIQDGGRGHSKNWTKTVWKMTIPKPDLPVFGWQL